jgi:hypothetical protein
MTLRQRLAAALREKRPASPPTREELDAAVTGYYSVRACDGARTRRRRAAPSVTEWTLAAEWLRGRLAKPRPEGQTPSGE